MSEVSAEATSQFPPKLVEKRSKKDVEITPSTFTNENLKMIPEVILHEPIHKYINAVGGILALGSYNLLQSPNTDFQVLGFLGAGLSLIGVPITTTSEAYKQIFANPVIEKVYPEIMGDLSGDKLQTMFSDGIRGFYSSKTDNLKNVYSTIDYKNRLLEAFSKGIDSNEKANFLLGLLYKTPDVELKLSVIKTIERNCKEYLSDTVRSKLSSNMEMSPLEVSTLSYLSIKWNLENDHQKLETSKVFADKLNLLSMKSGEVTADVFSKEIVKSFNGELPDTLVPYIRLYTLRRTFEDFAQNNLPNANDMLLLEKIKSEINTRLRKSTTQVDHKIQPRASYLRGNLLLKQTLMVVGILKYIIFMFLRIFNNLLLLQNS